MFVSTFLYNLGIRAYYLAALLISPFNKKANLWISGRKIKIEQISEESVWFHCASLGEFEQARPLIEKIKSTHPNLKIVLTFYSPSGYEVRKNYNQADYVYYLPLDTNRNAIEFIKKINPKLVFFVKYEFWLHFLNELKETNTPIFLISGIFREKQIFFKFYGNLFKKMLENFTHLFVQDIKSIDLLKYINIDNVSQANDSRFDRVFDIYKESKDFPEIENFVDNKKCLILGSSWLADEKLFYNLRHKLINYKLIIAPHNLGKTRIEEIKNLFPDNILYSNINNSSKNNQVLIIDNMGMLSSIYKYGDIAYIGGGFGVSIHNILEAAVYSIPVIFGPAYTKMNEAFDLIENKGGFTISNQIELEKLLEEFENIEFLDKTSNISGNYVKDNLGGTEKVLTFLKGIKLV